MSTAFSSSSIMTSAPTNRSRPPKKSKLRVRFTNEPDGDLFSFREATFIGRDAWMLRRLMAAGPRGVTTAELPAGVRASHFIFKLRRAGLLIESQEQRHGGDFPGRHVVYILRSLIEVIEEEGLE
jgi:hypothetical protein